MSSGHSLLVRLALVVVLGLLLAPAPAASADTAYKSCSATAGTCIRIGIFACPYTSAITGYQLMVNWYVNRVATTLGGEMAGVPVHFVNASACPTATAAQITATVASNFFNSSTNESWIDYVILPAGSNWGDAMNNYFEPNGIPAIASNSPLSTLYQCGATTTAIAAQPGCTTINSRRFQYAHGLSNAGEQFFQDWVGLLKLKKATTLAVVQSTAALYATIKSGVVTAASDYSMTMVYTATVTNESSSDALNAVIDDLITVAPDGLVLSTQSCSLWITAFKARDYVPNSLATVLCTDSSSSSVLALGDAIDFVCGSAQWNPDLIGNDYLEDNDTMPWSLFPHTVNGETYGDTSPIQFQTLWQELMGYDNTTTTAPGYAEAAVLAAFTFLEGSIYLAGSPDPSLVQAQLKLYYESSYFGLLSTNRYGFNQQKSLVINQRDADGNLGIVSPTSAATLDFIYPMPVFSERVYTQTMMNTTIEYIVIALVCLCSAFTLSLCWYLWSNRNHQVFQAAGLPFYLMMGFGCIVAYGSVLTWGVENNSSSCSARVWLWTLCFHMFVDPLLASSWRISRIFSQKLQTVKLTNKMVGAICLLVFAPQLLINILWVSISPFEPEVITPSADVYIPAHTSYTACVGGNGGLIFTGATLAYSGILLVSACYLAYKVRRAYRMFNDAKPIALSMYIFTVTAAIILVIQVALNSEELSSQKVLFGLRSVGVLICYTSSLSLLYFRRILGQIDVSKYQGNKSALDNSEDNTTSATNTGTFKTKPASNGKMIFAKDAGNANGSNNNSSTGGGGGATRNVHVHIQPPAAAPASAENNSPITPNMRLVRNGGTPIASPSRSGHGVGVSQLALENLNGTPKMAKNRPPVLGLGLNNSIVHLPPAIVLPTQAELTQMDNSQLITLVHQLHAQSQVLRSQTRAQNLHIAAIARGEAPSTPIGNSSLTSLPGTPDRSPRHSNCTPAENSRRTSFHASPDQSNDTVSIHPYGDAIAPAFTRQNSTSDAPLSGSGTHGSGISGDSNASATTPNHAQQIQLAEISPVSEIGPGSLK